MARRTLFTDAFPQANENPLSSAGTFSTYTGADNFQVVSNQVRLAVVSGAQTALQSHTGSLPNNQYAKIKIAAIGANYSEVDVGLRFSAPNTFNGYGFAIISQNGGTNISFYIVKYTAGVQATLSGPTTGAFSANDEFWFEAVDTLLTGYRNNSSVISVSDATYSAGRAAIVSYSTQPVADTLLDDFESGDFVFPAPPYTPWQQRGPILAQ